MDNPNTCEEIDKELMIDDLWSLEQQHMTVTELLKLAHDVFHFTHDAMSYDEVLAKYNESIGE